MKPNPTPQSQTPTGNLLIRSEIWDSDIACSSFARNIEGKHRWHHENPSHTGYSKKEDKGWKKCWRWDSTKNIGDEKNGEVGVRGASEIGINTTKLLNMTCSSTRVQGWWVWATLWTWHFLPYSVMFHDPVVTLQLHYILTCYHSVFYSATKVKTHLSCAPQNTRFGPPFF